MTHQVAVTISAEVLPGHVPPLRALLDEIGRDPAANPHIPFRRVSRVHFARLVLLDESADLMGAALPARLLLLLDCDAPRARPLSELVRVGRDGLDAVFEHCDGYPPAAARDDRARFAYLRDHAIPTDVTYVNTIGRTVDQVHREASLRDAVEEFLDAHGHDWRGLSAQQAREGVRGFVRGRPDLEWALKPSRSPSLPWRLGEKLHFAGAIARAAVVAPLGALIAPGYALVLRRREKTDPAPRLTPDPAHVERLAAAEDYLAQNQFTAVGLLKPGRFRRYTAIAVLWGVGVGARHIYNNGVLTGVRSIHFARWAFIDDRRRLVFASNYDGSLENYMDDFIDKVSWGLNAVFSNGLDYPRTRWLIKDGAKDELAFKSYIRTRQVPSQVWYSAYGSLTTGNIANNARIRAGLSGDMDEAAAAEWLRLL